MQTTSFAMVILSIISESSASLDQGRDHRLVEAVAVGALGDGDVAPARQLRAQSGIALGAVGDDEEVAYRGRDLEVLDRVADRDALLRVVAAGAGVGGDGGALADL